MMPAKVCKIVCVVGARPNFIKIAPILRVLRANGSVFRCTLLHTGQHYDAAMKASFFKQLEIPEPDLDLEVGSGSHAQQTAQVMLRFEDVLNEIAPDLVLVVGDVNSTIACALVAVKKGIPVAHVEAGLRSFDRAMPEEVNRVLTDQVSELLFTTERRAEANLLREGIPKERIHFVGNVMIDTLMHNLGRAAPSAEVLAAHGLNGLLGRGSGYAVLTLHRPSNVDDEQALSTLLQTLADISKQLPVVFPVHPRTRQRIKAAGLERLLTGSGMADLPPLGYLELLGLMRDARMVLTDSGGLQEETTALGVPCITLRENTERPVTIEEGTNLLVGADSEKIRGAFAEVLSTGGKAGRVPELWDGRAAERIGCVLEQWAGLSSGGAGAA
jgi:UDP-N-acetylglucosamine 2-epimerase (non-hydrolysing)